ncbi:folate family ECF transporter S component [Spiroplasma endosymbiont of Crioceris asparagi]|uniref:folate family ECF transporter S component n=1 Tax=Spiroplasma endosymbiont of Crioceris asparagi TaxID=3066286 RepID=UPI0030CE764D
MLFIYTNIIAGLLVIALLITAFAMEGFKFKVKTLHITMVSVICALSVILTNLLGYNVSIFSVNIHLSLGQWLMFLIGFYFGPILGVLSSIATDTIGDLINIGGGVYHAGFLLNIVLVGFTGALIKYMGIKHFLTLKIILLYSLIFCIQSLILNPIWIYSMGLTELVYVDLAIKLAKLPVSLFIYNSLLITTIKFFKSFLLTNEIDFWIYKPIKNKKNKWA